MATTIDVKPPRAAGAESPQGDPSSPAPSAPGRDGATDRTGAPAAPRRNFVILDPKRSPGHLFAIEPLAKKPL